MDKEKVAESLREDIKQEIVSDFIKNNFYEFTQDNKKYRVRKPTAREKVFCNELVIKKYFEYLQNQEHKTEKEIIRLLKQRGIEIDKMVLRLKEIEKSRLDFQFKLGKAIESENESDMKQYENKIKDLNEEFISISTEKYDFLKYSIENLCLVYNYNLLTIEVTEIYDDVSNTWGRLWKDYNVYQNEKDEELISKASYYTTLITTATFKPEI